MECWARDIRIQGGAKGALVRQKHLDASPLPDDFQKSYITLPFFYSSPRLPFSDGAEPWHGAAARLDNGRYALSVPHSHTLGSCKTRCTQHLPSSMSLVRVDPMYLVHVTPAHYSYHSSRDEPLSPLHDTSRSNCQCRSFQCSAPGDGLRIPESGCVCQMGVALPLALEFQGFKKMNTATLNARSPAKERTMHRLGLHKPPKETGSPSKFTRDLLIKAPRPYPALLPTAARARARSPRLQFSWRIINL
jgi:hypothetical protein